MSAIALLLSLLLMAASQDAKPVYPQAEVTSPRIQVVVHVPDRTHRSIHQQLGMQDDAVTTRMIEFAKQVTQRTTTTP